MNKENECPICSRNLSEKYPGSENFLIFHHCRVCGKYEISSPEAYFVNDLSQDQKYLLQGAIRIGNLSNQIPRLIDDDSTKQLIKKMEYERHPLQAIDSIVMFVYKKITQADSYVFISPEMDYPIACSKGKNEFIFFLSKAEKLNYLEREICESLQSNDFRLTIKGWERVDEIIKKSVTSNQAFVAMWFHEDMDEPFEKGFAPALEEIGYKPYRIDREHFKKKICDKIVTEINKSSLVVVDFTGNRSSVYFEAGYAMGLKKNLIWTCKKDWIDKHSLDFDTRQYPHIIWENSSELKEKLKDRIVALELKLTFNMK